MDYLPIEKEIKKLTRRYVGNVIYTVVGEPFEKWVEKKIDERNHKRTVERQMTIDMDPEVAKIF